MWQRVVKNTFWLGLGELVGRLLRVLLVLYAARILGAADWGIFSYALSLAALLTVVADIGIGAVLTRQLIKKPEEEGGYLGAALIIKIALVLLAAFIIIFVSPLITNLKLSSALLIFTALLVVSDNLRFIATSTIRALEKMHLEAVLNIITQTLIVISGLWVLYQGHKMETLALTYAGGSLIGTVIGFWLIKEHLRKISLIFNWGRIKEMLTVAWPFALLGILGGIMLNTDIIMLGWLRSAEEIGYYSAAQKIIFVLYILPTLIGSAVFPSLTRLAEKDKTAFAEFLERTLKMVFLIALPLVAGGLILGDDLINIFYGREYLPAVASFKILLISLLINYPATIIGNALFAYDRQKEFIKWGAIGAGGNIIFNFLFIPVWGIAGSAFATLITQIFSNAFVWKKMKEANEFAIFGKLNRLLLATLIMAVGIWILRTAAVNFFIILAAAVIIYFFSLYLLKEAAVVELKSFFHVTP